MEYKDLKKKSESELNRALAEQRDKLRDLRFKDANKQLKDVREIRKVRLTIAQCLTLLNKKRLEGSAKAVSPEDDPSKTIKEAKPQVKADGGNK